MVAKGQDPAPLYFGLFTCPIAWEQTLVPPEDCQGVRA